MRRTAFAASLLLVLFAAGCSQGSDGEPSESATSAGSSAAVASSTVASSPSSVESSTEASPSTAGTQTPDGPVLTLAPDGVGVAAGATTERIDFGADRATVTAALTATLGTPSTNDLPECGQGPRTAAQAGVLATLFDGDRFVGWSTTKAGDPPLTTVSGIGVGSTLAEVNDVYQVNVTDGTLGPEFMTADGTFGGLLTSPGTDGTVTTLWAGETCFFR